MERALEVTYHHHSGFSCAVGDVLLVFDYWQGEGGWLPQEQRVTPDTLRRYRAAYVFVSHSHPDHLDPVVFEWAGETPVTYVLSQDAPAQYPGNRMRPGETLALPDLRVAAFDSTDLGVSYLVTIAGVNIFHAGDLNFWHWREESTVQEIEEADNAFRAACKPLEKENIDLAFFPVDPRQGRLFDAGANYFIMTVRPRLLVPMHFWGRPEVAVEFARRARCRQTEVVAMTRPGDRMRLELDADGFMTVNVLAAPEIAPRREVSLDGYEGEDPFINTDLPVKLDDDP